MRNVIIVGAGRLGKGFMGEIFFNAGWQITFLDRDPQVIQALNRTGAYTVQVHTTDAVFTNEITGYQAYLADEHYQVMTNFLKSDLLMLPLYPADFEAVAKYLAHCFNTQYDTDPMAKKTLVCLTNKNHIIDQITAYFRDHLRDDAVKRWFDRHVVVRDAIVRRGTDAKTNAATQLVTTAVAALIIQGPVYSDFSDVEWLEVRDNVAMLKDIKVFLINGPHATAAYAGYLKNYHDIVEAEKDPAIQKLVQTVHDATVQAVLHEYPVTRNQIRELEYLPTAKGEMPDTIYRVGFDPIRKLGEHDRLMGVVKLCEKYGINPEGLIQAVACAFAYSEPHDKSAVTIQKAIHSKGIMATVSQYVNRDISDDVVKRIGITYVKLSHGLLL